MTWWGGPQLKNVLDFIVFRICHKLNNVWKFSAFFCFITKIRGQNLQKQRASAFGGGCNWLPLTDAHVELKITMKLSAFSYWLSLHLLSYEIFASMIFILIHAIKQNASILHIFQLTMSVRKYCIYVQFQMLMEIYSYCRYRTIDRCICMLYSIQP